jgi:hypothetical protein
MSKNFVITFLLALVASPIAVSIMVLVGMFIMMSLYQLPFLNEFQNVMPLLSTILAFAVTIFATIFVFTRLWYKYIVKVIFREFGAPQSPMDAFKVFAPIFASYAYYMLLWIFTFGITGYLKDGELPFCFSVLTFPYFFVNSWSPVFRQLNMFMFPLSVTIMTALILAIVMFAKKRTESKMLYGKKMIVLLIIVVGIIAACLFQLAGEPRVRDYPHYNIMSIMPIINTERNRALQ